MFKPGFTTAIVFSTFREEGFGGQSICIIRSHDMKLPGEVAESKYHGALVGIVENKN